MEHAKLPFALCFASPRELPIYSERATSPSPSPNGITDIIVRGEREKRARLARVRKDVRFIFMVIAGAGPRDASGVVYN